jgi:hypothetical protein
MQLFGLASSINGEEYTDPLFNAITKITKYARITPFLRYV